MTIYYISPSGNDGQNGLTEGAAWKTFAHAIAVMVAADELILLDGTYSDTALTGYMSWQSTYGGDFPSGISRAQMTYIHAKNPGSVIVDGGANRGLFMGRSATKLSYVKVQGITFKGGGTLYNTSYDVVKDCGFDGGFGIGTNDHANGNTYNLVEDVWIWADLNRIIAINYIANFNTWRRVIVRGDGCGTAGCQGSGNPNVGFTVYNSQDCSVQNMLVIDRILAPTDSPYGDFATAQHLPGDSLGRNKWLGCASINGPDVGYYFEADNIIGGGNPTFTVRNCMAFQAASLGFNVNTMPTAANVLENFSAIGNGGTGIRLASGQTTSTVRNIISINNDNIGVSSASTPSYVDVFNNAGGNYSQTTCSVGCRTTDPENDGSPVSLLYPVRIETGSVLDGSGFGGADYGATIINRYGLEGSIAGDADHETLTADALWPWPNEARIKKEMGADVGITRGFCSTGKQLDGISDITLTSYVWELLGNPIPADIYAGDVNVMADLMATIITTYDAGINAETNISANFCSRLLEEYQANTFYGITVNAGIRQIVSTSYAANINAAIDCDAIYDVLTMTIYPASVFVHQIVIVSATVAIFTISIYAATVECVTAAPALPTFPTLGRSPSYNLEPDGGLVEMVLRSPYEDGYEHARCRTQRQRRIWGVRYILTQADCDALRNFERETVKGSAGSFIWHHPLQADNTVGPLINEDGESLTTESGEPVLITVESATFVARFTSAINFSYIAQGFWMASFTLVEV